MVLAIALVAGCGKKKADGPSQVKLKQVNDALESAGFKTKSFQPADARRFSAQTCVNGNLSGVDTIVCEYGSPDALTFGKKAGEDWVGQATTGAVLVNGFTVLAVADRSNADPNGKTIHKITQSYVAAR